MRTLGITRIMETGGAVIQHSQGPKFLRVPFVSQVVQFMRENGGMS